MGEVAALKAQGDKIDAIKLYREKTGLGLKEAKDAVEAMPSRMLLPLKVAQGVARRLGDAGVPALAEAGRRARPPVHHRRGDGRGRRGGRSWTRKRSPTRRHGRRGGRTPPGCASGSTRTSRCRRTGWRLSWDGEDPRIALREDADLTDADVAALDARLERLDRASGEGAWTMTTLDLIRAYPQRRAPDLAEMVGRETRRSSRVRKLKALGLTRSFAVGYETRRAARAYLAGRNVAPDPIGWTSENPGTGRRPLAYRRSVPKLVSILALLVTLLLAAAAYADDGSGAGEETSQIEDYASYEPQTTCHPKPRVGTVVLAGAG